MMYVIQFLYVRILDSMTISFSFLLYLYRILLSKCYLNFDIQEKDGIKDMSVPGAGVIYHLPNLYEIQ